MTHYADLTEYVYSDYAGHALNVGWLSASSPFSRGPVAAPVLRALEDLASEPVNVMRGFHYCEFCDAESPIVIPANEVEVRAAYLRSGEIRISSSTDVYVAPTLIVHYISAHGYRPPDQFITAVEQSPSYKPLNP
jgi:hypothetical protein